MWNDHNQIFDIVREKSISYNMETKLVIYVSVS